MTLHAVARLPEPVAAAVGDKVRNLLAGLDGALVERRRETRMALLALIAGHHTLIVGPPGTAKSELARYLSRCFAEAQYFEQLLSAHTHPDELFGPVSIPALKAEEYRRVTDGYLPTAHVAFLDEVFNASGPLLHGILAVMNERVFHNGRDRERVPLLGLIAASNALPGDPELHAFLDRFLVRLEVRPAKEDASFLRICTGETAEFEPPADERIDLEEVEAVRRAARAAKIGEDVRVALVRIRRALGADTSDRRWRWAVDLARVAAVTSGRDEVLPVDILLLTDCLGPGIPLGARPRCTAARATRGGGRSSDGAPRHAARCD